MKNNIDVKEWFSIYGDFAPLYGKMEKKGDMYLFLGTDIQLTSKMISHTSGVKERKDTIRNISGHPLTISVALSKFSFDGVDYEVYTQASEWSNESVGYWHPLISEVGGQNEDIRMNCGNPPFVAIYNMQTERGYAFHIMANSQWQFRVKRRFVQNTFTSDIVVELGISERDFSYVLEEGETLELPSILYYEFENRKDMDAYKLHRYINEMYPARSMPIVYNSWMCNFDNIEVESLLTQLEKAKEIGAEYFVVDAGWFGKAGDWENSVGDWNEYLEGGFYGQMTEFADKVRQSGLKFGLWFEIECASLKCENVKKYPQYYLIENENAFLDFSNSDAVNFLFDLLSERIEKYGLEYVKFDYNRELTYDRYRTSFLRHFRGYRFFINKLRKTFPNLYLENCASGGMRMALANLPDFDSFWMSDNHSLYAQLEIYKNTLLRMPCRALEHWITVESLENFRNTQEERILCSGDAGWGNVEMIRENFLQNAIVGGPIGISCNLTALSASTLQTLKRVIVEYKTEREFWMSAECHILTDTKDLLVLQFNDIRFDKIKIYVYNNKWHQRAVQVYPVCEIEGIYETENAIYKGEELKRNGLLVALTTVKTALSLELKKKIKEITE